MKDAVIGKHHEAGAPLSGSSILYLVAVFSTVVAVVMLSISIELNWKECLVFTFTAATLVFGVLFTIVEMRRTVETTAILRSGRRTAAGAGIFHRRRG